MERITIDENKKTIDLLVAGFIQNLKLIEKDPISYARSMGMEDIPCDISGYGYEEAYSNKLFEWEFEEYLKEHISYFTSELTKALEGY